MSFNLQSATDCIKDHFDDATDIDETVTWLEGWICGYTDSDHLTDQVSRYRAHDQLFEYLRTLREANLWIKERDIYDSYD